MSRIYKGIIIAVAAIAIASALVPWYADYLQNMALKYSEMGYQINSLHTAQKAASLNPLSLNGHFVLAGAQQRLGKEDDARETLLEATRLQPENYAVWEQLAIYERDKWEEPEMAREHYKIAVSLNPQDKQLRQRAGLSPES